MPTIPHILTAARRGLAAATLLALVACAGVPPEPDAYTPPAVQTDSASASVGRSDSPPVSTPVPSRVPEFEPPNLAILYEGGYAGHAEVAARLVELLPPDRYSVEPVDLDAAASAASLAALRDRPALVIAVGMEAAEHARAELPKHPLVFCQVINYQPLLRDDAPIWGVHSVPPLGLQLRAWKSVDTTLRRIGLIVSDAQVQWIEEATEAAERAGVEIRYEISGSDRETIYQFKRLASRVDGFWLLPDNTILSPAVLRELLSYARSHDVGVLAFNEALLDWGALIAAASTTENVAHTVRDVVERVLGGRTEGLPGMTPLSEVTLEFNAAVARQIGLDIVPDSTWVLREPD